jgi:hypothetical protein
VGNHLKGTLPETLGTLQYLTTLCVAPHRALLRAAAAHGRGAASLARH